MHGLQVGGIAAETLDMLLNTLSDVDISDQVNRIGNERGSVARTMHPNRCAMAV